MLARFLIAIILLSTAYSYLKKTQIILEFYNQTLDRSGQIVEMNVSHSQSSFLKYTILLNQSLDEENTHFNVLFENYSLVGNQFVKLQLVNYICNVTFFNQSHFSINLSYSVEQKDIPFLIVMAIFKSSLLLICVALLLIKDQNQSQIDSIAILLIAFGVRILQFIQYSIADTIIMTIFQLALLCVIKYSRHLKPTLFEIAKIQIMFFLPFQTTIWMLALLPLAQPKIYTLKKINKYVRFSIVYSNFVNSILVYFYSKMTLCFPLAFMEYWAIKLTTISVFVSIYLQLNYGFFFKFKCDIGDLSEEICAICLNTLTNETYAENIRTANSRCMGIIMKTQCSHLFHYQCITRWMMYRKTCPLDNRPINDCNQ